MRRPTLHRFESLERRLAMAGLFNFTDVDGDIVTVRTSLGTNAQLQNALQLVRAGGVGGVQLQRVNLAARAFLGTNLTITARTSAIGGDGRVNVGEILSAFDLGTVTVGGDLARIVAGDVNRATPGVASFTVASVGVFGTTTGAADVRSIITGAVPTIRISGHLSGVQFQVLGPAADVVIGGSLSGLQAYDGFEAGSIGRMVIGGSILGGAPDDSGRVLAFNGGITQLVIGGDVAGGLGFGTGRVLSAGRVESARIHGFVRGGDGQQSGRVQVGDAGINTLWVGRGVVGGSQAYSGSVQSTGPIGSISSGPVLGQGGDYSGSIIGGASIGSIFVDGEVAGGVGNFSGTVVASGRIAALNIKRLLAGDGVYSGSIRGSTLGDVVVRVDISGSARQPVYITGLGAATPTGPRAIIDSLTVGSMTKALVLGGYNFDMPINGAGRIGTVTVRGNMLGSNIVAGVRNGVVGANGMPQFGNGFDESITIGRRGRIDSVVVNGLALGSTDFTESYGVISHSIGSVRVAGRTYVPSQFGISTGNLVFRLL